MKKTTAIPAVLALLSVCLIYLFYSNSRLKEELAAVQRQCQHRLARLQSDYQAELQELQQHLVVKPAAAATPAVPAASANAGDSRDAPEAFRKPELERYNESLEELVARKYRFLLTNVSAADRQALMQSLVERERLALLAGDIREYGETASDVKLEDIKSRIFEIEEQIQALLSSHDYQRYDLLKESDNEQRHFTQATLGIDSVFPLNNGQQEAVLFAKIRHGKTFAASLQDSGLYGDDPLTPQQREYLYATVKNAAETYKRGFLQDIKQHLDASSFPFDQYTLVENYTNTEFQQMLDEIKKRIDARGAQN